MHHDDVTITAATCSFLLAAAAVVTQMDWLRPPITPTAIQTISYRQPKIQDRIPIEKETATDAVSLGWPRVLPSQNNEPTSTEAWASATPTERYLCEVYWRIPVKRDRSGDFSWKDRTAAGKRGMGVCEYAIGGMSPDFKDRLASMGRKLDEAGYNWSILSAFRDDFRQTIASGFKAAGGNSLHGGSRATKGYGDGRAIDITVEPIAMLGEVFKVIDTFGRSIGLVRPMPRYDAAHIQAGRGNGNKKLIAKVQKRQHRAVASNKGTRNESSSGSSPIRFAD